MDPSSPPDTSAPAGRRSGERTRHDLVDQDNSLQDMFYSNVNTTTKRQTSHLRSSSATTRTAAKLSTAVTKDSTSSAANTVVKSRSTRPPVSGKIRCLSKNKSVKRDNKTSKVPAQPGKTHKREKRTPTDAKDTPKREKKTSNTSENDVELHLPELDSTPDSSKTSSSSTDCQSLYLQTSTFSSGSRTHLSNSPSTSPPSTGPWGSRPAWDSVSSPILSDTAARSVDTSLCTPPPKNALPRCAVVNFRREGDVVKWIPRARENTGGIAARVHDFDDAFKLEELSSRNFAMAPRYFSSVSAARIRFDPRRDNPLSSSSRSEVGKWAERVRQLSNGTRSVTRQLNVGASGGRVYLGAAITHVKNSQNATMNTVRMGSDLSSAVLKGPRLIEESVALNRVQPAEDISSSDNDKPTSHVKLQKWAMHWTKKRLSGILQLRQNGQTQDRGKYYPPQMQEVRCNRISLSAADFRAIAGPPAWDTRDVNMRKQSLPPMSTMNQEAQCKPRRKHSLPRRFAVPDVPSSAPVARHGRSTAPKVPLGKSLSRSALVKSQTRKVVARSTAHPSAAPLPPRSSFVPNTATSSKMAEKEHAKQKKRILRGLFGRRKHDELVDSSGGGQFVDVVDDDIHESYLRRVVSSLHVRRSSLAVKPTLNTNGDQYMQFIGRT